MLLLLAGCGRLGFDSLERDAGGGSGDSGDAATCTVRLGAGRQHTTAIFDDGTLRVWGYGAYGQIGDGQMMDRPTPTPVSLGDRVTSAAGGRFETCASLANGRAWCWGEGDSGQLGDGAGATSATPVQVANLTDVVEVAAAAVHACARLASGDVWCWGAGANGRLGTGGTASSDVPVKTAVVANAVRLATGGSTTCAIGAGDTLRCWGYNQTGGVGDGTTMDVVTPVEPMGIGAVRSVALRDTTTCAVQSGGDVYCWGSNNLGQAGTGTTSGSVVVPTPVRTATAPLTGADEVGQGIEHGCARLGTAVWCWGNNTSGQLGDGTTGGVRAYAAPVVGLPPVTQLGIGAYTSCAVDEARNVWCWGRGSNGELGNGLVTQTQPTPALSFAACP